MNLKQTYNKIAEDWYEDHQQDDWWQEGTDKFASMLEKGAKVLDVGCGAGVKTKYLVAKELDVFGFDFSENLVDIAKKNNPGTNFKVLDIYNLDEISKTFDGVFAQAVLLHIPKKDIPQIISKLNDKLKPNGLLYVAVKQKNENQKEEEIKKENDYGYEYERFFSFFKLSELRKYIEAFELEIVYENIKKSGKTRWIQIIARKEKKMIKKVGKKWILYNYDGTKILGHHDSKKSAERQEAAINISKARTAGHRIPKKSVKK